MTLLSRFFRQPDLASIAASVRYGLRHSRYVSDTHCPSRPRAYTESLIFVDSLEDDGRIFRVNHIPCQAVLPLLTQSHLVHGRLLIPARVTGADIGKSPGPLTRVDDGNAIQIHHSCVQCFTHPITPKKKGQTLKAHPCIVYANDTVALLRLSSFR